MIEMWYSDLELKLLVNGVVYIYENFSMLKKNYLYHIFYVCMPGLVSFLISAKSVVYRDFYVETDFLLDPMLKPTPDLK